MSFDALVFDMDGTLTDSEAWWDEIRRALAEEDGVPWPAEATTAMMGMSTPEWSRYLSEVVGLRTDAHGSARRTIETLTSWYHERGVPVIPGAVEAVRRMAALLPIGLATSSPREHVDAILDELGLTELFGATVSTEECAAGKPDPEAYVQAATKLGADPTRCVAVEDSTNGIRSALAAGMTVVAIPPHFHPPAQEVLDQCAAVLESIDELTPELITRLDESSHLR